MCEPILADTGLSSWDKIVLPIALFVAGILVSFVTGKLKISRRVRNNQNYLFTWIDLIKEPVDKQISELNKFSILLDDIDSFPDELGRYNLHVDKLKTITPIEMVNTFITNKQGNKEKITKLFFDLSNQLDYMTRKEKNISDSFSQVKEILAKYYDQWNSNMTLFNDVKNKFLAEGIKNMDNDPFVKKIFDLFNEWRTKQKEIEKQTGSKDSNKKLTKEYLDKIGNECNLIIQSIPEDKRALEFIGPILRLGVLYNQWEINSKMFAKRFSRFKTDIEGGYNRMVTTKNELVKYRFRNFLFLE